MYDEFSAAIPSDTAAARVAAISAQLCDAVRNCISATMSGDVTWLLRPTRRESVNNGGHDVLLK